MQNAVFTVTTFHRSLPFSLCPWYVLSIRFSSSFGPVPTPVPSLTLITAPRLRCSVASGFSHAFKAMLDEVPRRVQVLRGNRAPGVAAGVQRRFQKVAGQGSKVWGKPGLSSPRALVVKLQKCMSRGEQPPFFCACEFCAVAFLGSPVCDVDFLKELCSLNAALDWSCPGHGHVRYAGQRRFRVYLSVEFDLLLDSPKQRESRESGGVGFGSCLECRRLMGFGAKLVLLRSCGAQRWFEMINRARVPLYPEASKPFVTGMGERVAGSDRLSCDLTTGVASRAPAEGGQRSAISMSEGSAVVRMG
ncbi:hypothetical protein Esti_002527 [Eimeria stiedai]